MSDAKLKAKYALICSIEDNSLLSELSVFSSWFLENVTREASTIGLYFDFEDTPTCVSQVAPGSVEECTIAYEKLYKEYPSVQLVIHILPKPKSEEYDWMKALASRYGLVRQGILLENALNRFTNMDHKDVFRNVAQWVSRSLHKLCNSKDLKERAFDIRVGSGALCPSVKSYNPQIIQSAVNIVLHGSQASVCKEESAVQVEGFANSLNEFGVSQLFGNLCVTGVSLKPNGAIVTFVNKFHAYQACSLNNKKLDRMYTLRVHPLSEEVLAQVAH